MPSAVYNTDRPCWKEVTTIWNYTFCWVYFDSSIYRSEQTPERRTDTTVYIPPYFRQMNASLTCCGIYICNRLQQRCPWGVYIWIFYLSPRRALWRQETCAWNIEVHVREGYWLFTCCEICICSRRPPRCPAGVCISLSGPGLTPWTSFAGTFVWNREHLLSEGMIVQVESQLQVNCTCKILWRHLYYKKNWHKFKTHIN